VGINSQNHLEILEFLIKTFLQRPVFTILYIIQQYLHLLKQCFLTRIGNSKRPQLNLSIQSPGPAKYNNKTYIGEGPKIKINCVGRSYKINKLPGPCDYSPSEYYTTTQLPKAYIGSGPKFEPDFTTRRIVPGVGKYVLDRNIFKGPKFK